MAQASLRMKTPHAVLVLDFHQLLRTAVVAPGVAVIAAMVMVDSATKVDDSFPGPGKE